MDKLPNGYHLPRPSEGGLYRERFCGGGGRKSFGLVYGGGLSTVCGGLIGSSKFCLKHTSCGVASHSKKFDWDGTSFYVKENETRAFSKPTSSAKCWTPLRSRRSLK
jgi:hypothetical protein